MWTGVISKQELPEEAKYALNRYARETKVSILSKFFDAYAWGYNDDDYTHLVVITTEGEAYLVEGAALRPTIVTKL